MVKVGPLRVKIGTYKLSPFRDQGSDNNNENNSGDVQGDESDTTICCGSTMNGLEINRKIVEVLQVLAYLHLNGPGV
jgi:hypothetical protein